MLIVCPTCSTSYEVTAAILGENGRSVRCASCKNTWFASPEDAEAVPAMATASASAHAASRSKDDELADAWGAEEASQAESTEPDSAVALNDSPPIAPEDEAGETAAAPGAKFDPGTPDQIESAAARRVRERSAARRARSPGQKRALGLPILIGLLIVALIGAIQWRTPIVRALPQTAKLFSAIGLQVNLRGLVFENVKSTTEIHEGVTVLVVEGTIANVTRNSLEVPRLRFALRNGSNHEVYAWTALPLKPILTSGEEIPFRSRLASPPADGQDVIVRFFGRRDVGAGLL